MLEPRPYKLRTRPCWTPYGEHPGHIPQRPLVGFYVLHNVKRHQPFIPIWQNSSDRDQVLGGKHKRHTKFMPRNSRFIWSNSVVCRPCESSHPLYQKFCQGKPPRGRTQLLDMIGLTRPWCGNRPLLQSLDPGSPA